MIFAPWTKDGQIFFFISMQMSISKSVQFNNARFAIIFFLYHINYQQKGIFELQLMTFISGQDVIPKKKNSNKLRNSKYQHYEVCVCADNRISDDNCGALSLCSFQFFENVFWKGIFFPRKLLFSHESKLNSLSITNVRLINSTLYSERHFEAISVGISTELHSF